MAGAPNITAKTTDAELYRFAVATAESDKEILRTLNSLQKIRNEARKARAEVTSTKALIKGGRGGVDIANVGTLGARGFSISGRYMRGAAGLMLLLGGAQAAENMVTQVEKYLEQEKELGRGEALGRLGGDIVKSAFRFATGREGGRAISRLVGRLFGNKPGQTDDALDAFERTITTTALQKAERKLAERMAQHAMEKTQSEFIESEIQFLETWRPQNIQLRTSADVAVLKRQVWAQNEAALWSDIKENRRALAAKAKTEIGKD